MKKAILKTLKISSILIAVFAITIFIGVQMPKEYYKANPTTARSFILKNCHIVDIENNKIDYNQNVVVKNGVIVSIDSVTQTIDPNTPIIDAKGSFVMPSLWDMHVHTISLSPQLHFPLMIAHGVTHIRDLGDGDSWASDIENTDTRDKVIWERMETNEELLMPKIMEATSFHLEEVDGLDEKNVTEKAKEIVEKLKRRNEPFVKVQLDEDNYPTSFFYEIQKQAKVNKIPVLGHLPAHVDASLVFTNGFRSVEHAWALIPHFVKNKQLEGGDIKRKSYELANQNEAIAHQVLELMKTQNVYYCPTHITSNRKEYLAFDENFNNNPNNKYINGVQLFAWKSLNWLHTKGYDKTEDLPVLKAYYDRGLEVTNLAHKKGVKLLAGTDALDRNVYHGLSLHEELQELTKAGLSNAEALKTATINPAQYYGLSDQYGSISVGKKAAFILLDKNPLENIAHTQSINAVFFNDRFYPKSDLENMKKYTIRQAKSYGMSCKFIWNMLK
ncbi:MAG: amidohydrolase family protein [Spirosomataceae bacterium]